MMLFTVFIFGVVLVAKCASGGEKRTCQVHTMNNQIIDLKKSQAVNPDAKVLRGLNTSTSSECQKNCCSISKCTLFVYHHKKEKRYSCFLVSCSPKEKCVFQPLQGSLVGQISRVPPATSIPADAVIKPTTSTSVTASNTTPKTNTVPSVGMALSQTTVQVSSTSVRGAPHIELHSTPVTSKGTDQIISTLGKENATVSATINQHGKVAKNLQQHTTSASLVIALCFGILFLFAVIILIGRPWWDAFNKPRYSKVDYLMNGL